MRTKRAKHAVAIFAIFALILSMLLSSCAEQPDIPNDTQEQAQNPNFQRLSGMAGYGDFVYFCKFSVFKYNKKTGVFARACQDIDCEREYGSCLLDGYSVLLSGIADNKLFFFSMTKDIKKDFELAAYYAYLDLHTNEVVIIHEGSFYETGGEPEPLIDGDYVYYTSCSLKPGGDKTKTDDYLKYAYRYEISSGKKEQLFQLYKHKNEKIEGVTATHLITYASPNICQYDLSTGECEILFDTEKNNYTGARTFAQIDNELYFCAISYDDAWHSEYAQRSFAKYYLMKMDLETGKAERLRQEPVYNYAIDRDRIYYTTSEVQHFYIPDDYKDHPEKVKFLLIGDTLHSCDLNGGDYKAECHLPYTDFAFFSVINGNFYGEIQKFDTEKHEWGGTWFSTVDLSTGEITPATLEK